MNRLPGCIFTPMPPARYPSLFQVNTRVRLTELARALGRPGDARRRAGRGAGRTRCGRLRPRLVPRRLADGRGRPEDLAVEAGVARGVPAGPAGLRRGRRPGLVLRGARVPGPRGLRRRRGARAPAREAPPARPAPDPRLRPEPRRARPCVGLRTPGVLRRRDRGEARGRPAELDPHAARHPRLRPRSVLRRLAGHAPAELRQPGTAAGDDAASSRGSPGSATACAATWRCSFCPTCSSAHGASRAEPLLAERDQSVRRRDPGFLFLAEVYWDLEWALQQQGFDYAYDKRLYDRLEHREARPVRRALPRGPRLPGPARALSREPRRAPGRRGLPARGPPGGCGPHVLLAGAPLLPPGSARGEEGPDPDAPRPRAVGAGGRRRSARFYGARCSRASRTRRSGTGSGSSSRAAPPGRGTPPRRTSSPSRGRGPASAAASSP